MTLEGPWMIQFQLEITFALSAVCVGISIRVIAQARQAVCNRQDIHDFRPPQQPK